MLRVTVTVADPSDRIAQVSVGGDDTVLGLSQSRTFSVPDGETLTIGEGEIVDRTIRTGDGEPETDIGEGMHTNPNGILTAEIAPKSPKPGGETIIERVNGVYVETTPKDVDQAAMRRGGGPDSQDSQTTPGPKPRDAGAGGTVADPASEQGTELRASGAGTQVAGAPKPTATSTASRAAAPKPK